MIKVTDISTEDLGLLWPKVGGWLGEALERSQGEYTLEDVYLGLSLGFMTLWIAYENGEIVASAVCELRNFSQRRICYLLLMAGEGFSDWSWAINAIEDWAQQNGADAVAAYTRRGFTKPMAAYGYREVYTVIQKDLTDRRLH